MKTTQRVRRAGLATMAALVIGGSGVAVGTAIAEPATTASTAAKTAPAATPGPEIPGTFAGPASYAGVVKKVLPSVVLIRTADGLGSGVVLDTKGNIVTNAHVAGNAREFQVQVAGDTSPRSAKLVGSYAPDDLAVIRADNPEGLRPATFGDSDQAQAGDVVLAIGNPLGLSGSVTQGIVSATDRAVTEPATDTASAARRAAARPRASASPSRPTWPATSPPSSSTPATSPTRTGPRSGPRSRLSSARTARRVSGPASAW
jgi:S1-C subfamily serine protease